MTTSLVQFGLASLSLIAGRTVAREGRNQVDASPRVLTGTAQTFVHIQLTLLPFEPWQTQALVPIVQVQAGGVVTTGKRLTLVDVDLAVDSSEAGETLTLISVNLIHAGGVVFTWSQLTLFTKISFKLFFLVNLMIPRLEVRILEKSQVQLAVKMKPPSSICSPQVIPVNPG